MGIEKKVIEELLDQLELYLTLLERMEIPSDAELLENHDVQHLVSGLKLGGYQESADLFQLLTQNKIIEKQIFNQMKDAIGERNVLVHKYASVDYPLIVRNLKEDISDLRAFAAQIHLFLEKQKD